MSARSFVVSGGALVVCVLGAVLATGCVVEPEEEETEAPKVLAKVSVGGSKPNLMLLVDTSRSMTKAMEPLGYSCLPAEVPCGNPNTPPCDTRWCPTRWSTLQGTMQNFLDSTGSFARIGLATYPSNDACGATVTLSVPLPDATTDDEETLAANAEAVKNKLLSIQNYSTTEPMPRGETPTRESLQFLGTRPELQTPDREDIVLLVTDGLPNCNAAYPEPYPSSSCFCTSSDCSSAPEIGCLDKDASVMAVQSLRAKDIKTFVVGIGVDFDMAAERGVRGSETLNAMAEQGGFAHTRACVQHLDCVRGDRCDTVTQLCKKRFYSARSWSELASGLQAISERVRTLPCLVRFADAGSHTQESLAVFLDGQVLAPGESSWSLTSEGVLFTGTACEQLAAATTSAPVLVEVRAPH